jgi:type IV pilus assembly protein PilO
MSLLDQFLDGGNKQKLGLLIGGVLAFLLIDWTYIYGPRSATLDQVRAQVTALEDELQAKRTKSNARAEFERELQLLTGQVRQAEARLPDEREIASLLSNIASNARAVGLDLTLFRNRQESYADFYARVPVEMTMRGTYHELAQFLDRVKRLDRIVNVSDIAIRQPDVRGDLVLVDASCTATTFRFLDEAERARIQQQQQQQGKGA